MKKDIEFTVFEKSDISLSLYDIFGKQVLKLIENETFEEGTYKLPFDVSHLRKGIYSCIMDLGGERMVSKIVLAK